MSKKHLIILGHGEGDPGAQGVTKTERAYLEDLGRELNVLIKAFRLNVEVQDKINVYKRNDFAKRPELYKDYHSITEIHFNAYKGLGSGGEIIFGSDLVADAMDKRFESYLKFEFGFRRYIISDYYQNPREAKRLGLPSYRLVELCFCDNPSDIQKFVNRERYHAKRILEVITEKQINLDDVVKEPSLIPFTTNYIIQLGAFNDLVEAGIHLNKLKDLNNPLLKGAWIRKVK